jgi:hypothetical protein
VLSSSLIELERFEVETGFAHSALGRDSAISNMKSEIRLVSVYRNGIPRIAQGFSTNVRAGSL